MESIFVLIGGLLLGIPIIAVIALVRSGITRRQVDEISWDYRAKISDLRGEIANLRRELAEVSQRAGRTDAASSPAPPAAAEDAQRAAAPPAVSFAATKSNPAPFVRPSADVQSVTFPVPHASLKQAGPPQAARVEQAAAPAISKPVASVATAHATSAAPRSPQSEGWQVAMGFVADVLHFEDEASVQRSVAKSPSIRPWRNPQEAAGSY
jgi:hypothetical protein